MFAVGLQGSAALGLGYLIMHKSLFDSFRCACTRGVWALRGLHYQGSTVMHARSCTHVSCTYHQMASVLSQVTGLHINVLSGGASGLAGISNRTAAQAPIWASSARPAAVTCPSTHNTTCSPLQLLYCPMCGAGGTLQMSRQACCTACLLWPSAQPSQPPRYPPISI